MKLAILLPNVSPAVASATVSEWHQHVGAEVAFGDELFDVNVAKVSIIPEGNLAARVRMFARSKVREAPGITVIYRITSMDDGTLSAITAPAGTSIGIGDSVGQIDTNDGSDAKGVARTSFDVVRATQPGSDA